MKRITIDTLAKSINEAETFKTLEHALDAYAETIEAIKLLMDNKMLNKDGDFMKSPSDVLEFLNRKMNADFEEDDLLMQIETLKKIFNVK